MKRYAIYNTSGIILRIVQCVPEFAALQVGEDEAFIEVEASVTDQTHSVLDGVVVPIA